jgi:hypothetical protein
MEWMGMRLVPLGSMHLQRQSVQKLLTPPFYKSAEVETGCQVVPLVCAPIGTVM